MKITMLLLALSFSPSASARDWSPMPDGLPAVTVPVPAGVLVDGPPPEEAPLECRPAVIAAFKEAWSKAGSGREEYEAAFRVDRTPDGDTIEFMPMTHEPFRLPVRYSPAKTIAIVHTHPDAALPIPGPGDYAAKVPNFVLSRRALYVTIPGTRRHRYVRRDWDAPCAQAAAS